MFAKRPLCHPPAAPTTQVASNNPREGRETKRPPHAEAYGGLRRSWVLLGALEHLDQAPTLGRRERPRLHQRDAVADTGCAVLVVGLDLGRGPDDLAVERMLGAVLQLDHDGLLHLVAHHVADA